jgi:hypothetical protein
MYILSTPKFTEIHISVAEKREIMTIRALSLLTNLSPIKAENQPVSTAANKP